MANDTFERSLALVLELEGGFVEHLRDPGGATKYGITRATLADARGQPVSVADVKALTRSEAATIYRRNYWDAVGADALPAGIDLAVFDQGVHSGPGRAVRALQKAVGAAQDGRMGPLTRAAAEAKDPQAVIRALVRDRMNALRTLSTWSVFGRGWTARVRRVEAEALALASDAPRRPTKSAASRDGTSSITPAEQKEITPMTNTKSPLASRTVWANLIGLGSLGLGFLGVDVGAIDANGMAEAMSQAVAAASFIASTFFRVTATRQIAKPAG